MILHKLDDRRPIEETEKFERMTATIYAQIIAINYRIGIQTDAKTAQYAMNAALNAAYLYCANYNKVVAFHKEERERLQAEKASAGDNGTQST